MHTRLLRLPPPLTVPSHPGHCPTSFACSPSHRTLLSPPSPSLHTPPPPPIHTQRADVVALLDEWAARFFEELDYVREGANATRFAAQIRDDLPQV